MKSIPRQECFFYFCFMRERILLTENADAHFTQKLLTWADQEFPVMMLLNSNQYEYDKDLIPDPHFDFILAAGARKCVVGTEKNAFSRLSDFLDNNNDWCFGNISYDVKNELEDLVSRHPDQIDFPALHFFIPNYLFFKESDKIFVEILPDTQTTSFKNELLKAIRKVEYQSSVSPSSLELHSKMSKTAYIDAVEQLRKHIKFGDIYEVNYCQEFFANATIKPLDLYIKLNALSPTPFSSYYKIKDKFLISSSPERYLKKTGQKIYSQPIKGTIKRGKKEQEDLKLIETLKNDPKERAENIMITDLVRNDLSHLAKKGSVQVEELCGIYTFPQVHQMISTISAELKPHVGIADSIKQAFPMGSMTGAPKVRAMQLIEQYEKTKRGLYSGTLGYISPEKNYDFNVIIRSILYNESKKYLSFMVGGAITYLSNPENEYKECLLKAEAITKTLNRL